MYKQHNIVYDMKTKIYQNIAKGLIVAAGLTSLTGCSRSFLDPDPLSMYEPTTTFSTESGLQAALAMADRHISSYWTYWENKNISVPIATEYMFSDMMLYGKTDAGSNFWDDVDGKLTPTNGMRNDDTNYIMYFWDETYNGLKYANTVLSYIDGVKGLSEEKKNEYKGRAYFHQAFRYYALCWQFGDVPLVTKILAVPKQNYRSTKREAILKMCVERMEKAVEWVPFQAQMNTIGMVNKEACRMLLAKLYLSVGEWDKAEKQCDELINNSGLALMEQPFGNASVANSGEPATWNITRNVIWDLHRPENKYNSANKEVIFCMPNISDQRHIDFLTMRIFGPNWSDSRLKSPDGKTACVNYARNNKNYNQNLDNLRAFGRGIATFRLTWFAQKQLWDVNGVEDTQDYRHNSQIGNWVNMTDMKYNGDKSSPYYGKNLQFRDDKGNCLTTDSIRDWFDFPLYKFYLKDVSAENNQGANQFNGATKGSDASWYLYRLAEAYLLRAEARLYQGNVSGATKDVNKLRERAHASQLYSTVNIGDIMNERARELLLEEWRNVELTRVSYDLAKSGVADEWGNTYSLDNWDKQDGTDMNGGSYWYQRIMHYSLYNKCGAGIVSGPKTIKYTMNKHNLFWPIPNSAITANKDGQLFQTYGYNGYDASTPEWDNWEDAVADEDKTN